MQNITYASENRLKIVASIAPLADFARQVGGNKVDVLLLLPPGSSPHTYEPTPRIMRDISNAKVFIKIGAGLEFWADRLIRSGTDRILTVDSSEGIELIRDIHDSHHHSEGEGADPHIWLDPAICMKIINRIASAFSKVDPSNSAHFKKNASAYIEKLVNLDREIADRVKLFRKKQYITFHPAWNYFSKRYGLTVAGVIEEGPGKEPNPKHLTKILQELRRINSRIVFAETQFNPKIAEAIAQEAGAQVLFLDPIGGQKNRETYIDMMRYNISIMEKAMK